MAEERSQDDRFSEESDIESNYEKEEVINDTKKYSCDQCRKPFSNPLSLKVHLESVQDFLIKLDMKPCMHLVEISIFSLNLVIVRLTKIMNRADKNWAQF